MKKFFIVFFVFLMASCAVLGLGMFGIVRVPGLRPLFAKKVVSKKEPAAPTQSQPNPPAKEASDITKLPPAPSPAPTPVATKPAVITDPDKGAKALASIWNEMETDALVKLVANWKDADLARVLVKMDADKVAEILANLKPDRASKVSQIMQKQASVVPTEPES